MYVKHKTIAQIIIKPNKAALFLGIRLFPFIDMHLKISFEFIGGHSL